MNKAISQGTSADRNSVLNDAVKYGIIDLDSIGSQVDMIQRRNKLNQHKFKIWQGSDGKYYTYLPVTKDDGTTGRKLLKRATLDSLQDVIVSYYTEQEYNPSVADIFSEWNNKLVSTEGKSKATYDRNARFFQRHYYEFGKRKVKSISKFDLYDFLQKQIVQHGLDRKAFNGLLGITRGWLKYAYWRELINFSPEETIKDMVFPKSMFNKKTVRDADEVFTHAETMAILDHLRNNLDLYNIGILLLCVGGLRIGELIVLKHSDIIGEDSISITKSETMFYDENGQLSYAETTTKTEAGNRIIHLPPDYTWLAKKLRLVNPFSEYIFTNPKGVRMNADCFRNRLRQICKELGIPPRSPHKLRKTYATMLIDAGVDQNTITELMGHTSISCTEKFYHRDRRTDEEKAATMRKALSMVPEFKMA